MRRLRIPTDAAARERAEPMPSHRLIAIITALTCLSGAQGAYAAASTEQLVTIESLIVARNCIGLRNYLDQYPALLEGEDALAQELRSFVSGVDSGLVTCLAFRSSPGMGAALLDNPVENDLGTVIY